MLLRHYLEQGLTKRALADKLGISRDTIHRWIREGELDRDVDMDVVRYGPRAPVATKLDPYKGLIQTRLERYPELSAIRLLDEIKAAGYGGRYTQLKEYVRAVRPRPEPDPVVRFETPPGKQGQVDFAEFRFPWGRRYALLVVLAYSRLRWLRFYERQDMRTLVLGLEEAFRYFGGVPQELLVGYVSRHIIEVLCPVRLCGRWRRMPGEAWALGCHRPHNDRSDDSQLRSAWSVLQTGRWRDPAEAPGGSV